MHVRHRKPLIRLLQGMAFLCSIVSFGGRASTRCAPRCPLEAFVKHPRTDARRTSSQRVHASLLGANDAVPIAACLLGCGASAQSACARWRAARALSAPVCAMLFAVFLSNIGVFPNPPVPVISSIQATITKVATPLLLFNANLRRVVRDTRSLSLAFCLACIATVAGAVIAFLLVKPAFPNAWQLCAAIAAKNIGGGINYHAVVQTYGCPGEVVSMGLNVDNLMGLLYFPVNSWLADKFAAKRVQPSGHVVLVRGHTPLQFSKSHLNRQQQSELVSSNSSIFHDSRGSSEPAGTEVASSATTVQASTTALAVALGICSVSDALFGSASIPGATAITVGAATVLPSFFAYLAPAAELLGTVSLYVLFACAGAATGPFSGLSSNSALRTRTRDMLLYCAILYVVHNVVVITASRLSHCRLLRTRNIPTSQEIVLASNAGIGGPATAAALAKDKEWTTAVVPATVVGHFGNSIGTFVGLALGRYLFSRL